MPDQYSKATRSPQLRYNDLVSKLLLDRYRVISQLDEGGSGTVLLAWDQRIARRVAIKCLELSGDARNARASLQEARIAALLQHPHIVQILDFETVGDGTAYLIMEYLDGITLAEIPSEDLDSDIIAAVIEAIGSALAFAHENGVLHLDVKPGNILIGRNGQIKLADFGLSLLSTRAGHHEASGGTLGYMPLEQLQGLPATEATDQWALAAVLYELCTDEYPYFHEVASKPSQERLRAAQEAGEAPLLKLSAPGLTEVFARALARDPRERYGSVAEFCAELAPYFGSAAAGEATLRELCEELTADDPEDPDDQTQEEALAVHSARQERRARKQAARPARGFLGWLSLLLSLLAVLAAAIALIDVLVPALITQLFGDKRLAIGIGSVSFFILVCMILLLIQAALRRRD